MRFFLHKPYNNNYSTDLLEKVEGVSLKYNIAQFFASGGGYNGYVIDVRKEIDKYPGVGIAVQWGALCGNYIWDKYPYIELIEKHHEGAGNAVYNKFPVPWEILEEIRKFLEFLSWELMSVMGKIKYIKITGINQQSPGELRVPNQHFKEESTTPSQAYKLAYDLWKALGYSNNEIRDTCRDLVEYYHAYFPGVLKVAALIQGTAGFVKMDDYGMYNLKPPVINDSILFYLSGYPDMSVMATALTDVGGTPANFVNSGVPVWYQLNNQKMNRSLSKLQFESAVLNGLNHGGEGMEIYEINVREHYDIILKYS